MDTQLLHSLLKSVQKPGQYLGNEVNSVHKDFNTQKVRVALVFPDAYEMGMSHMGLKILYDILNNIEGVVAERCFAPLPDMESALRNNKLPLFSLESKTPLKEFDVIGISLPYELTYTNVLNILDLAQIPLWQRERGEHHPIILGGGTQSYNPEAMADFFDAIAIGDGEELVVEFVSRIIDWKRHHGIDQLSQNRNTGSRVSLLNDLTSITGIYVPSFFDPIYNDDGTLKEIKPLKEGYASVEKRVVKDLDAQPYPTSIVVPNIKLIHDRIGIEIQRGCTRMCRFCQAGYIERPTRQRSPEKVLEIAEKSLEQTGIDEISLLSLSAGDYKTIVPMLKELNKRYSDQKISISVPATRTETLTPEMIAEVKKVRRTGFTIAPEAGSERMRRVINKGNKVEDLMQACRNAFSAGYQLIKFYYMCGLPFETDDDVVGIAQESGMALKVGREYSRAVKINVSVSSFVPKPFTPFQWEPQMTIAETRRKHSLIRSALGDRALQFKHHAPEMSFLEGLFSRGDRRLSQVIHKAFELGCRFDEWSEHFDFVKWQKAIEETQTDTDFYVYRRREKDETLPWDHLFSQMQKEWLWNEYLAAAKEAYVADCSVDKCASFCGVCDFKEIKNRTYVIDEKPIAAKKGNREWYGRFGEFRESTGESRESKELIPEIECSEPKIEAEIEKPAPIPAYKLRVQFSKTEYAALIGHLELMNILKRAILRNRFEVAYTEGFHPQMKLAMGYALSLGVESECESFDLVLKKEVNPSEFINKMNIALPQGLTLTYAEYIDLSAPSIYSLTESVDYKIWFSEGISDEVLVRMNQNLEDLKNGKEFNLVKDKPGKKPKTVSINHYLRLNHANLETKEFHISVLCDLNGSLKPADAIEVLSGLTQNEVTRVRVRKVGVTIRQ